MDKSIKKYLTKIIKESYVSDIDEMAFDKKGVREPSKDTRTGLPLPQKDVPYSKDKENPDYVEDDGKRKIKPDYWIQNPTLKLEKDPDGGRYVVDQGERLLIVPTDCQEATSFIEQNREWLDSLTEEYNLNPIVVNCKRTLYPVRNLKAGTSYQHSGEFQGEKEKNQRKLGRILRSEIFGEGFNEVLNKKSIPSIKLDRQNIDMHEGTYTNEKIVYRAHNNNSYESAFDFLNAVIDRFEGNEGPEMKTYHMARQYNTRNAKWNADRKMDITYQGQTPIYGLAKRGYEEANLDVTIRMDLDILGEKMGESFVWNVRMKVNLGKKLTEDRRMKGGFDNIKLTQVTKTAQLEPGKEFNENYVIMDDINVVNTLIEAINELKSDIDGITLEELLPYADVEYIQTRNLNESKERLIRRIVKQIKL
jgi:hypothetical protein